MELKKMKLGDYQEIFSLNVARLLLYAEGLGLRPRLRECQRTIEQQQLYIEQGRSWTKNSAHLDSLAIDIYFTKDSKLVESKEELQPIGNYWESLYDKNQWGGNWQKVDCPHFELRK